MDDEKRYPDIEEEDGSCMKAGEADYETVAMQRDTSLYSDEEVAYDVAPGTFGSYTDSVQELQHHVAAMEAEINDPNSKWISSEQMWSEIKQEFPWLKFLSFLWSLTNEAFSSAKVVSLLHSNPYVCNSYLTGETICETGTSSLFCTSQIVPDLLERFFMPNFAADSNTGQRTAVGAGGPDRDVRCLI